MRGEKSPLYRKEYKMKFSYSFASDWQVEDRHIEINSLDELKEFYQNVAGKDSLIIDFDRMHILIYNDYIE